MSQPDVPDLAEPVIPLAYSQERTPAAEMVWIVRFIAAYLIARALLQAMPQIVRACSLLPSMAWSVWLNLFWAGSGKYETFRFCAAISIALALWRLRREAFWGLFVLLLVSELAALFVDSGHLLSWIMDLPSTVMALAALLMVYRRASRRGVLRPTHSLDVFVPSGGVDVRWFMGIVGFWMLVPVVGWVVRLLTPRITGLYEFAFSDFFAVNCVSSVFTSAMAVIGLVLIVRRSHRVLPLLATPYLVCGIMTDLAIRWDMMHNPKFAGMSSRIGLYGSVHGLTLAALVTAFYLRARRWAHVSNTA